MKKSFTQDLADMQPIHKALDAFFLARIGIRVLMGHYAELVEQATDLESSRAGKNSPSHALLCKRTRCSRPAGHSTLKIWKCTEKL